MSGELMSQRNDHLYKYYGEFDINLKFNFVEYFDENGDVIQYKNTQSSILISPSKKYIILKEGKMSITFEIEEISYMIMDNGEKLYSSPIKFAGIDMGLIGWNNNCIIWIQDDAISKRFINIK